MLRTRSILVIAGTDSSGGAGLSRDIVVATELGFAVKPVVTAVTAQSNDAVRRVELVAADLVKAQIEAAFADDAPPAVKIGMLGDGAVVRAVADALQGCDLPIVLDPVLAASSGAQLLSDDGIAAMKERLLPWVTLVTPNLPESEILGVERLHNSCRAVLLKGGHGEGDVLRDVLTQGRSETVFSAQKQAFTPRGTGCTLSTAIACGLADGLALEAAVRQAHHYVQSWITGLQAAD
ncbi:bifunctional hydroxymethylpyrimidine kinase/phosphomethylpyrimidine kinase [Maritalea mediterranea]|uniref:hydroxymethylpyrimidine kinase n=1 Tax=Maritalea mediterranea TaxID=2909667 RepID=A0ABS9E8M9_9HYPH|nr:hydroxymethylpyrimidine/phosphomethylpyrimidine kinase [Maritalea mediterranea]MCF4099235.1 hydroxymethylpyrimidine/phosphomethylpyrimidine kinase [Maritalea mediterranea]